MQPSRPIPLFTQQIASGSVAIVEEEDEACILTQALRGIVTEETVEMSSPDFDLNVEMVNEILNELQEDQDLRDVLEDVNNNEDEGIGLNYFDEIELDIQPFNYDLEVEPYNF